MKNPSGFPPLATLFIQRENKSGGLPPPGKEVMKMRVTGSSTAWPARYSPPGNRRGENDAGWGKYLDPEVQKRKMAALPEGRALSSVYMQFVDDYMAWKAKQPELTLPDSQGWAEENLAFLRELYAGDLSAFEVYDALETMRRMGVISQKEMNATTGNQMIAIDAKALGGFITCRTNPDSREAWLRGFDETPLVGFRDLEDIFSWVEKFRTEDHPDAIPWAEAVARGWI